VLVLNMHAGYDGAGVDNLAGVAALIQSTAADVVLLQEVDRRTRRSGGVDQPLVLEQRTGLRAVFGRTLDYDGGEYGIATFSRWRIDSTEMVPLPVSPSQIRAGGSQEPRGALVVSGRTGAGALQMINTHLDASREDVFRLQEADGLRSLLSTLRARGAPIVAGGDFNSTPDSAVQQRLRDAGLRDAWRECASGDGFTFPASAPVKRIDYLFLVGRLRCTSATVIESTISDHRPLLVVVVPG
jgi:endonuclease/exonuclease/phosphatase family metal-dependent hydrolase